ncbi:hypothetical protein L6164_030160 [Bauhinia variegata]|uniref:Uncharacterized protein n=1 Tax=Bauhinia variegata TaxID=167791 RepID=A0ACB9LBI0_BAUVA|nr:hypothetical protein L6164_030160 [Bauhinia variegata]
MDCSVCTTMPLILRPPRNTICGACYEAARSIINMMNKLETQKAIDNSNGSPASPANSCKNGVTLSDAKRWCSEQKDMVLQQIEDMAFLRSFVDAYKQQIHTDILVIPGDSASPIPAHKAILATRSEIFKNMLDFDECKAAPNNTIVLPELKYKELESLLEFLYSGTLAPEKLEKHVYALILAADKYEISHLQKHCERYLLNSLSASNALDILEIAETCSNQQLMETTFNFLVENIRDIVCSSRFEEFARKCPHLNVQLIRASLNSSK